MLTHRRPYRPSHPVDAVQAAIHYGKQVGKVIENWQNRPKRPRPDPEDYSEPAQVQRETEPLTGQYDYKTDYRKRRLGYRKRRALKRSSQWRKKIVNTVRNANVGTTHILRRSLCQLASARNASNAVCFGLYGQNGTTGDDFNPTADIREIFREISETDWQNALSGTTDSRHHKIYAMSATMEMTIKNNGDTDALVEAYFIRGTYPVNADMNPVAVYADGFRKAQLAADPNTGNTFDAKLAFNIVGTTPFQCPYWCSRYRVYKRTKFRIPPGNEVSFVMHDPKPRTFEMSLSRSRSTDKNYHGVLFQQQGAPSPDLSPDVTLATATANVSYFSVRRYRLKMFRDNLDQTALDPSGS